MAILTATRDAGVQQVEWLHWLFVHGDRAISCDVEVRGDGVYTVTLFPLWAPEDQINEIFARPGDAMRRHSDITRRLQASGWLLLEAGVVTNAA